MSVMKYHKLGETDLVREIVKVDYGGHFEIMLEHEYVPSAVALFAMELMRVGGNEPPKELVERACEIADRAFEEFERREWLYRPTSMAEIEKMNLGGEDEG